MLKPGNVKRKISKYAARLVTFIPNHVRESVSWDAKRRIDLK
jgi:hypothetical protein